MKTSTANANRVYQDIELPSAEWVQEEGYETLIVNLQGYKKENLRIQVTSTRNIRVLGERPVRPENNIWQRFRKEFPVPSNCDVNETSARLDNGFLYVKIPKTIAPVETATNKDQKPQNPATGTPPPPTEAIPKPQKPTSSTTTYVPQPAAASAQTNLNNAQRTNAASQEQTLPSKANKDNKTDGSLTANSGSQTKYASNAVTADPKAPVKEKVSAALDTKDQPSKVNERSTTFEGAAAASTKDTSKKTSMDKEKSDRFSASAQNVEEKSPTTGDVNRGKRVHQDYSAKEDAETEEYCSMRTQGRGYYRQVVDGLIMELKEPRKLVNLAMAFGCVLVLGLYVKYAINSIKEFKREEL
ncbi:inactive protein RESTRICTED TEV MOVEMENT 2 [Argentina anserina]|uniref:inactive protein RESTRICTED TEV MOVEMENT 2 n=1 Tax=Argentina anserina TaxID=57926 RepID=UPI0021764101|nr:inactive protein RESTRICTED TEV MOVEMENT 2 [Potentilla anserina]